MRTLWIEYPRKDKRGTVLAALLNVSQVNMKYNIPVQLKNTKGIEIKLPSFLSGVFYLKIQDGDQSFLRRLVIQ